MCASARCVSICNPPCGVGDVCTATGDCVAVAPAPGAAAPAPPPHGVEEHDGFFLRLTTGPAGAAVSLDIQDEADWSYQGGGWSSSIDIGGALARNLVMFGRLRGTWLFDPSLEIGGDEVPSSDEVAVQQGLAGVGLNYYVMPVNIYFGGAIGFANVETWRRRRNREPEHDQSKVGFGIDLDAGWEWWVSDNWGLGVALRLSFAGAPADDGERDAHYGSGAIAILFSATYQ